MQSRTDARPFFAALAIVASLTLCSTSQAQIVGYWNFDGNTDDQTGNGNDGTIVGGVTYNADVPATIGSGMSAEFDGVAGTYVNVTQNQRLPVTDTDAFSIAMWVKGDGTTDNNDDRIFSEGMTTDNTPLFNLGTKNDGADGRHDFFFRNDASTGHLFSNAEPFDNEWHHIAWVDSDHVGVLYIDGVEDSIYDYAALVTPRFAPDTTTIGGILRATDCCNFTGLIDEVAIWDTTLAAGDVTNLFDGASPLDVPEPPSADFNGDGVVNTADFFIQRDNFLGHLDGPVTPSMGDYDRDGDIDLDDFGSFKAEFPGVVVAGLKLVPEPSSFALLATALLGLLGFSRRRCS